ncbi:MAG: methionine biosynthesis protein MetW [Beijerinckiaceae bacterium]|jgi:methionine biosynthesis protein MetW
MTTAGSNAKNGKVRRDHAVIADMIEPSSRVLDVGCGDGALLVMLRDEKQVDARGVELSQLGVNHCVANGLSVIQGDADSDLSDYPDDVFDYVILSQTLQATRRPKVVLEEMLRIGKKAVVSIPNFGHWRIRLQLLFLGRMPVTRGLSSQWYETQNIHFCTIRDFVDLSKTLGAHIEQAVALDQSGGPIRMRAPWWFWNLFGEQAVFLLTRKD